MNDEQERKGADDEPVTLGYASDGRRRTPWREIGQLMLVMLVAGVVAAVLTWGFFADFVHSGEVCRFQRVVAANEVSGSR